MSNKAELSELSTCGMEYYPLSYLLSDGSVINVHIRDTCGQEQYNAIWNQYYKMADGILLVFDISNRDSFDKIKNFYVKNIKEKCKPEIPIILLGNKTDLEDKREVSQEEAIDLSTNEEFIYKESSCVENENVIDSFETIIEIWNINNKKKIQESNTPIKRSKSKEKIENDNYNPRSDSFALSERTYSLKNNKISNDNEEEENIKLNKKGKKKRKKKFC